MSKFSIFAIGLFIFVAGSLWLIISNEAVLANTDLDAPSESHAGANEDPLVWQAREGKWLRDPNIYRTKAGTFILTGTEDHVVEYQSLAPGSFEDDDGVPYFLSLRAPNGERMLRREGFREWEKKFFDSQDGLVMVSSLPTVENFNRDGLEGAKKRSSYLFEPIQDGRRTKSGFPLDWRMQSNEPWLESIYNGGIFDTGGRKVFVYADVRYDKTHNTTCVRGQRMSRDMRMEKPKFLLCPGRKAKRSKDQSGWDRDNPLPSEVRFEDGGGLLEGAWGWQSPNGPYFLLYSSGDYTDEALYGAFVAECSTPMGPCRKVMRDDKKDVRFFVEGNSKNYERAGRAFPVIDASGQLVDIIFHARRRGQMTDDILRCLNFSPTIIEEFASGGAGCAYDNVTY
ncbi:hypothetical protein [Shimia sp.]|uniref:hypothetical protein n=1 Tax=Shimia sp. TaxID=1954381 RepID=UPI00329756A4